MHLAHRRLTENDKDLWTICTASFWSAGLTSVQVCVSGKCFLSKICSARHRPPPFLVLISYETLNWLTWISPRDPALTSLSSFRPRHSGVPGHREPCVTPTCHRGHLSADRRNLCTGRTGTRLRPI